MPLFPALQALLYSATVHRKSRRKDQIAPYINHPLSVVYKLAEHGVRDEVILCAGALHSMIEDEHIDPCEIEARFGPEVAHLVIEVTNNSLLSKVERKRLQIENAHTLSLGAKLIKMADKICKMTELASNPPPDWQPELIRHYAEWCGQCVLGYRTRKFPSLEKEFDATVAILLEVTSRHEQEVIARPHAPESADIISTAGLDDLE